MGMNYYVKISEPHKCASCSKKHICQKTVHIGKSSYGNHFRFAYNKGKYYKTVKQLKRFVKRCKVVYDEDDYKHTPTDFWREVCQKEHLADKDDCVRSGEMLIDGSIFVIKDFF